MGCPFTASPPATWSHGINRDGPPLHSAAWFERWPTWTSTGKRPLAPPTMTPPRAVARRARSTRTRVGQLSVLTRLAELCAEFEGVSRGGASPSRSQPAGRGVRSRRLGQHLCVDAGALASAGEFRAPSPSFGFWRASALVTPRRFPRRTAGQHGKGFLRCVHVDAPPFHRCGRRKFQAFPAMLDTLSLLIVALTS
jgi:hypothetical protein